MRVTEAEFSAMKQNRQTPAERAAELVSARQLAETMAEAEIENQILDFLRFSAIPHTRTKAELSRSNHSKVRDGWPDITACYQGTLLAIEVKASKGKLRKAQVAVLSELWSAGALVVIARSVADVQAAIRDGKHYDSAAEISKALLIKSD